jgi:serine/threonine protein kinase
MEYPSFFEHYRICTNLDGSPNEVSRIGAAINYKATDTRSGEAVGLQLIPLLAIAQPERERLEEHARLVQKLDHVNIAKLFAAGVEHDYFALVAEHLEGETADAWIVAHGAMTADAVLHIALQVVRAIGAAAFHGLTHRAVQPSNLMIVPGQSPDGGWPFVKLLNFGLAGLELHSPSGEGQELAPAVAPEFSSPEQLLNHEIDFRSQMYSLGATMCLLLTGAVPLMPAATNVDLSSRFPQLRRFPKSLRNLLAHMLRQRPEDRPHDPVVFEKDIRKCLTQIEHRQAIKRKLGIPLAVAMPKKTREPLSPFGQIWRGVVAVAALILAATAVGAFFFPNQIPLWRRSGQIGVPIGVPEKTAATVAKLPDAAPIAATQPPATQTSAPPETTQTSANVAQTQTSPQPAPLDSASRSQNVDESAQVSSAATAQQPQASAAQPAAVNSGSTAPADVNTSTQVASAATASAPAAPAEGPDARTNSAPQPDSQEAAATSDQSRSTTRKKTSSVSTRRSTSRRAQNAQRRSEYQGRGLPQDSGRSVRARVVGTTEDGRVILRLPSGRIVFVRPGDTEGDFPAPPRRRLLIRRPDIFASPPDYFPYDSQQVAGHRGSQRRQAACLAVCVVISGDCLEWRSATGMQM